MAHGHTLGYESPHLSPGLSLLLACLSPHLPGFRSHFRTCCSHFFVLRPCVLEALHIPLRGPWKERKGGLPQVAQRPSSGPGHVS